MARTVVAKKQKKDKQPKAEDKVEKLVKSSELLPADAGKEALASASRRGGGGQTISETVTLSLAKSGKEKNGKEKASNKDEGAVQTPATDAPAGRHGKKRKRQQQDLEALTPEELERRKKQKELRALALRLRGQGKEYTRKDKDKYNARAKASGAKGGSKQPAKDAPQVIVLPIFWEEREAEKQSVMESASAVEAALREAGVRVGVDTTNKHTPGQKMRYWEERGVRLRVELGPQDVQAGRAVLALCGEKAGEVAQKEQHAAPGQVVQRILQVLEERGQRVEQQQQQQQNGAGGGGQKPDGGSAVAGGARQGGGGNGGAPGAKAEESKKEEKKSKKKKRQQQEEDGVSGAKAVAAADEADAAVIHKKQRGKKGGKAGEDEGEDGGGLAAAAAAQQQPAAAPVEAAAAAAAPAVQMAGGDDLGDDFGLDLLATEEQPSSKKGRKGGSGGDSANGETDIDMNTPAETPGKKKKKHKIVKF